MLESTSPYFGFSSHGCFLKDSSKVEAPSMKGTEGGAGGSDVTGTGGGAGITEAFRSPGMKSAGGGAGGAREAFTAPETEGAGGGAGTGGAFTAPGKGSVSGASRGLVLVTWFSRFFHF